MLDFVLSHTGRRVTASERLTGGSKKGVHRLRLDDGSTVILYVWAAEENYWPPSDPVPDDPFVDASGPELFAAAHAALSAARVRVPDLLVLDHDRALVEDVAGERLEALMARDPEAAAQPLAELAAALRRMHTTTGPRWGRLVGGSAGAARPPEDMIVERALRHLDAVAARDDRLAAAHRRLADQVGELRAQVAPRAEYALVHGELGPDHVLIGPAGEPVMIDIEGVTYFDVEWEHAWLQLRFGDAYPALRPVECDPRRLELYRYCQTIALIEGPLRIAATDFPERQWMLDLAERNIRKVLAG